MATQTLQTTPVWSAEKAYIKMCHVYDAIVAEDEIDFEFISTTFARISVFGHCVFNDGELVIWKDDKGDLAFVDPYIHTYGVYYQGFAFVVNAVEP